MKLRYLLFFFVLLLVGCTSTPTSITISFVANGGTATTAIEATSNTSVSLPIPTRRGYEFQGWYSEDNVLYTSPNIFSSNMTLYAKWSLESYTVRFFDNENQLLSTSEYTTQDDVVPPTPPIKENLVFARWEPAITQVTADTDFYAIYLQATDGLIFTLQDDHYVVSGYEGSASEVIVPELIFNKPVTMIESFAFANNTVLTSITLPDSITLIKAKAFYEASNLSNVVFPAFLEKIETEAFYNCFYLTSITLPATIVGESAFYGCSNLATIVFTNRVTRLESWSFLGCSDLVTVTIPDSVTYIGNHVFSWCQKLDYIYTNPENLTNLQALFAEATHIYTHFVIMSTPE